jgi:hypothetical protein
MKPAFYNFPGASMLGICLAIAALFQRLRPPRASASLSTSLATERLGDEPVKLSPLVATSESQPNALSNRDMPRAPSSLSSITRTSNAGAELIAAAMFKGSSLPLEIVQPNNLHGRFYVFK